MYFVATLLLFDFQLIKKSMFSTRWYIYFLWRLPPKHSIHLLLVGLLSYFAACCGPRSQEVCPALPLTLQAAILGAIRLWYTALGGRNLFFFTIPISYGDTHDVDLCSHDSVAARAHALLWHAGHHGNQTGKGSGHRDSALCVISCVYQRRLPQYKIAPTCLE